MTELLRVALTPEGIKKYLNRKILETRRLRDTEQDPDFQVMYGTYVDAFQQVRKDLFGEKLE